MFKSIEDFIAYWNYLYPIDLWWRRRYKVSFNSLEHRRTNLLDILFEILEEIKLESLEVKSSPSKDFPYIKGTGNFIKEKILTEEEIDKEFDKIKI